MLAKHQNVVNIFLICFYKMFYCNFLWLNTKMLANLMFSHKYHSCCADHLPTCAEVKHLQILCDDEEIGSTSYVDLKDYLRQGYDVRCQLRPCYSIVRGPVVVEIQTYKNQVLTLLNSLQLSRNEQQVCSSFNIIATDSDF